MPIGVIEVAQGAMVRRTGILQTLGTGVIG